MWPLQPFTAVVAVAAIMSQRIASKSSPPPGGARKSAPPSRDSDAEPKLKKQKDDHQVQKFPLDSDGEQARHLIKVHEALSVIRNCPEF